MPIGKDSIKTRVAKVSAEETAAETPAEVKPATAPAKKAASPKKPAAPKAPKAEGETAKAPAKKAATKKPAAPKAPKAEAPVVETAVLANVAPETVAAVIGHDEKKPADKVQIGQKMPNFLL